jgi:hypothetical protein
MPQYATSFEYLTAKLEDERNTLINTIIQGKLPEAEYKRLCGSLQGLDLAINHIKDLAKRVEENDE